ncbi:MAG: LacI family DNA-binding transcriptional regulator [Opitutales bacterium]|nr:LacI family DNA-binding transcriptional regulator [Opitutales bacterium]
MNVRKKKTARAATLADVGRAAGVSAMAVSAALNETRTSARISELTRVKILEAAEALGYRPNVAARALVKRRMNTIGVSVVWADDELNNYFVEIFNGIIESSSRHGQNATVFTFHNWAEEMDKVSSSCDGRIDGMILVAPLLTVELAATLPNHTPFVALHANTEYEGIVNIESNEESGAREMVNAMISMGHRRIMHVSGPRGLVGAERRIRGYYAALNDAGIEADPALLVLSKFTAADGCRSMLSWLKSNKGKPLPDAIFCANDAIAIGCMEALASMGVRIPDEVSICGFDDTLAARTTVPQLSTVRQPLRMMGAKAVDVLMRRIDAMRDKGSEDMTSPVVFDTSVVLRGSIVKASGKTRLVP